MIRLNVRVFLGVVGFVGALAALGCGKGDDCGKESEYDWNAFCQACVGIEQSGQCAGTKFDIDKCLDACTNHDTCVAACIDDLSDDATCDEVAACL